MEQFVLDFSLAVFMSLGFLELIKWVVRRNKPGFEFPVEFYKMVIPGLNIVSSLILAYAGFESYVIPSDGAEWLRSLVMVLAQSAFQMIAYNNTLKSLNTYETKLNQGS